MFEKIRADRRRHGSVIHNPALLALIVYRFGRWSMEQRQPALRWITGRIYGVLQFLAQMATGIYMRREATIGEDFHLLHPGFTFIHPRAVIGDRVGIMHNVTIGTNMDERVPVIGNDVFIGCGASILGDVKIGDNVRIAANSLVIKNVPPNSFAVGVPAKAYPRLTPGRRTHAAKPAAVAKPEA